MSLPKESRPPEVLNPRKIVVFTDADGTLIDHKTYSFDSAKPALSEAKVAGVPIHIVTSKTFAEVEALEERLGILGSAPFSVENGSANYIPKDYFPFDIRAVLPQAHIESRGSYDAVIFNKPYAETRAALNTASQAAGVSIHGIGDMSAEEFAQTTGLLIPDAQRGKKREFQEGFLIRDETDESREAISRELSDLGFQMVSGGRFHHVLGGGSKSEAVASMMRLYDKKFGGRALTVGIGDSQNDLEFIQLCDKGFLVSNPHSISKNMHLEQVEQVPLEGPAGWNSVVLSLLK